MMLARLAPWIALAGCGRFGFHQPPAPDPDAPLAQDQITLILTSDEYGSDAIGTPIPGATVIVEHDDGRPADRLATDASGTVQFPAAGVRASHVVFKGDLGWRLYTVALAHPGTVELGSRPETTFGRRMTFGLPDNGSGSFTLRLPQHCASPPASTVPSVIVDYPTACEGRPLRVVALSQLSPTNAKPTYLDAGKLTLTSGTSASLAGSYAEAPLHTIKLLGVPAATASLQAQIFARAGLDLTPLAAAPATTTVTAGATSATLQLATAPGGDTISVLASAALAPAYTAWSERIAPTALTAATVTIDAAAMLPLFTQLTASRPPGLAWTGTAGGTIIAVEANAGTVQWDAYLEPTATTLAFPSLPADLMVPVPTRFDFVALRKFDVAGVTTPELARTIDRGWNLWPHDAQLLPAAGAAAAGILYSAALGPP